jgi:hypothetical protein
VDKATRDRFALLDFDPPPAKAASPPAPDQTPAQVARDENALANANAQQYAMLQAMQNNPYQQGLANQLSGAQQNVNALYGYAAVYPELAARIISDPPAPDDAGLSPLDRLRYLLAGRTPPK